MITRLADWCKLWRMVVNKDKTQIVHFRPVRRVRMNYNVMLDGRSLGTVDTYKYLGIPKSYSSIEQVQFKALRYFIAVHRFAPTDVLLGDAGWTSCFTRHKLASLRLWNRLISMPPTRLTNKIFIWDLTYCQERTTWSNHILEIFRELNAVECFNEILTHDPESAYQILKENEVASWEVRRYSKPKLRYYNMIVQI